MGSNTPRRYCILALGSRGDVQPFVALGLRLREHGHAVIVAAAADYGPLVEEHGLPFAPLVGRIADLMDREAVYGAMDGGMRNPLRLAGRFRATVAPLMDRLFADARAAAEGADALIVSTLGQYAGHSIAEWLGGIPLAATHFHPYTPSAHYAHMFWPPLPPNNGGSTRRGPLPVYSPHYWGAGGAALYNRLTHRAGIGAFWHYLRPVLNGSRRRVLGLPPLSAGDVSRLLRRDDASGVHLHAYSAALAPPPPDWDSRRHVVTGYWPLPRPRAWEPPPDLTAFLHAGEEPVYVGFGSILAGRDPDGVTRTIVDALGRVGARGILYAGWGDLGNVAVPSSVFVSRGGAYHDWLFPRCRAVVHHGGAGTTAAALRAGTPAVVVPFFGDQRFWARRLQNEGASPAPVPRATLTADRLAGPLAAVLTEPRYAERSKALGAAVAAEDGAGRAVRSLEEAGI